MITYEKYAEIRDKKKLTDGKIAKICGFGRSTFSDWKSGRSVPKLEKMQKIAAALDMDYSEFVGPVGKFSSLNPDNPLLIQTTATKEIFPDYIMEYAERIMGLSKSSQAELINYMNYLESKENK